MVFVSFFFFFWLASARPGIVNDWHMNSNGYVCVKIFRRLSHHIRNGNGEPKFQRTFCTHTLPIRKISVSWCDTMRNMCNKLLYLAPRKHFPVRNLHMRLHFHVRTKCVCMCVCVVGVTASSRGRHSAQFQWIETKHSKLVANALKVFFQFDRRRFEWYFNWKTMFSPFDLIFVVACSSRFCFIFDYPIRCTTRLIWFEFGIDFSYAFRWCADAKKKSISPSQRIHSAFALQNEPRDLWQWNTDAVVYICVWASCHWKRTA